MKTDGKGIDYASRVHRALRGMIADLLREAATDGLPDENHFYVTFRTDHSDVLLPETLRSRYPEEMTVVLQHQFWDLTVDEECFSVTLRFSGVPHRITVPYRAISAFVDPAAEVGFRFEEPTRTDSADANPSEESAAGTEGLDAEGAEPKSGETVAEVVPLSRFRKV